MGDLMKIDKAKIRHGVSSSNDDTKNHDERKTRPSIFTENYRGEYYNISIKNLISFHKQARKHFDEEALQQMADTIRVHGIRQPLTIISTEDNTGRYEIVSGERRYKAAIMAGLETVPCIIIHDKKAAVEIALIENVQRQDLHPIELAQAYQQLLDEKICDNKNDIAKKLGLSRSSVTETMKLLILPEEVRAHVLRHNIVNRDLFREILDAPDSAQMLDLLEKSRNSNKILDATTGPKRKVLLKVVLQNGQIFVDTNTLSTLSSEKKNSLRQELQILLQ